jgi:hypothetical protein
MAPSGVNNVLRAHQGALKRWYDWTIPKRTAGSSTAYTLTYDVAPGALVDGMPHLVEFDEANGASATLNVNALGAIPLHILKPAGWGAIPANTVVDGMVCRVVYHDSSGAYRIIEGPTSAVEVSGSIGYSVGPRGIREQWGTQNVLGSGGVFGVSFPVSFSALYSIQITEQGDNTKPGYILTPTVSGFVLVNPGTTATTYYWRAIGST